MRIAILLGALAGAAMFSPSPSAATDGPWCLRTKFIDCSQPSYETCRFAGSPESGYCYPNLRHRRRTAAYGAMDYGYWGPPLLDSWGGTAYAPRQAHYSRNTWAWSAPSPHHWGYWSWEIQNFWRGYQPVMLRMPPPEGTQDRWCLTVRYTTCSIPSYEVCRFAASPESGYCFPNPNYAGGRRPLHAMARAHRYRHGGYMAVAARATAPAMKVAESRAAAQASVGVDPATDSALTEIIARTKDIDGDSGAFAMAEDTTAAVGAMGVTATTATAIRRPAASSSREQVKVASLTPDASMTLAPMTPAAAPRKGATASGVPTINVMPSCRAASTILGIKQNMEICLKSEASAHDQLVQEWAEFLPAERASCTGLVTMGGGGTYTELMTCLDLRRFARNMHKDEPVRTAGR